MISDNKSLNRFILGLVLPVVLFLMPEPITGKVYLPGVVLPAGIAWILPNMPERWVVRSLFNVSACYALYWMVVGLLLPELKTRQAVIRLYEYLPVFSWGILFDMYADVILSAVFPGSPFFPGNGWSLENDRWLLRLPLILTVCWLIGVVINT